MASNNISAVNRYRERENLKSERKKKNKRFLIIVIIISLIVIGIIASALFYDLYTSNPRNKTVMKTSNYTVTYPMYAYYFITYFGTIKESLILNGSYDETKSLNDQTVTGDSGQTLTLYEYIALNTMVQIESMLIYAEDAKEKKTELNYADKEEINRMVSSLESATEYYNNANKKSITVEEYLAAYYGTDIIKLRDVKEATELQKIAERHKAKIVSEIGSFTDKEIIDQLVNTDIKVEYISYEIKGAGKDEFEIKNDIEDRYAYIKTATDEAAFNTRIGIDLCKAEYKVDVPGDVPKDKKTEYKEAIESCTKSNMYSELKSQIEIRSWLFEFDREEGEINLFYNADGTKAYVVYVISTIKKTDVTKDLFAIKFFSDEYSKAEKTYSELESLTTGGILTEAKYKEYIDKNPETINYEWVGTLKSDFGDGEAANIGIWLFNDELSERPEAGEIKLISGYLNKEDEEASVYYVVFYRGDGNELWKKKGIDRCYSVKLEEFTVSEKLTINIKSSTTAVTEFSKFF